MGIIRRLSFSGALIGGIVALVMTLAFVLAVGPGLARLLSFADEMVVQGIALLMLAILRALGGVVAAHLARRAGKLTTRVRGIALGLVTGTVGWALYVVVVLIFVGGSLGDGAVRLLADVVQWALECALGAMIVPLSSKTETLAR